MQSTVNNFSQINGISHCFEEGRCHDWSFKSRKSAATPLPGISENAIPTPKTQARCYSNE